MPTFSRRTFVKTLAAAVPAAHLAQAFAADTQPAGDPWRGLKIGVATYTLRKYKVDEAIKAIQQVGLKYASIKDMHLPLKSTAEERKATAAKFRDAGITPLSCGVITFPNNEAGARAAFEYARDAGIPTIVCDPDPASMAILDKLVKEFDIRLAIHNHGPESKRYPTPFDAMKVIEGHDPRIGLCIDVGHTARAGVDPAESILKCKDRLYDVHLKDIDAKTAKGKCVEGGRGVLDLKGILAALLEVRFARLAGFEYEKDGDNPIPGLTETANHVKGLLAKM